MNNKVKYIAILLISIVMLGVMTIPVDVKGQTYLETFGQNRLQYRKFAWKYFDTKHFRIYHYDRAGKQLARYVAEEAEQDIKLVEQKMGGQFPRRFNIIIYNSYDEYKQTNIGLKNESQEEVNTPAGTVDLVGDKLVVYFTGVHADLRHQIRAGMSRVMMEHMIFGESFRQMVKSAVSLNLPPWVTEGYISYLVDGWDTKANSQWKSLLDARPKAGFYDLSEQYPELAGKAFWEFVSEQYGDNTVKNLLYTMQQKSNLNQGMKQPQTLNMKVTKAYDSCIKFYKNIYALDAKKQETPDSSKGIINLQIPKDNTIVRSIKVSPKGNDVAYVTWKDGEYNVYEQKTANEQQRSLLLEGGRKDYNEKPDPDYPMLCWSNNGYKLAILYKKGTETRLRIYNSLKARVETHIIPKNRFDRILGMTFMEEDDKMVFSAIRKSQTDLYEFTIRGSRIKNITDDAWDDLQPWFVSGGTRRGILFLSNRPKPNLDVPIEVNQLPVGTMNVFFYDTKTKRPELLQLSNVTKGNVTQPIQYGSENFAYLYDSNGIQNKYVVVFGRNTQNLDSAYAVPITNYSQNIISHQYNPASNSVADVVQEGDKYRVYFHKLELPDIDVPAKKLVPTTLSQAKPQPPARQATVTSLNTWRGRRRNRAAEDNAKPLIKNGNAFQSEFGNADTAAAPTALPQKEMDENLAEDEDGSDDRRIEPPVDTMLQNIMTDSTYVKMRPSPYRLSFKPDFFTVRLDNSVLFNQYQSIASNGGQYSNPSLSGLVTISLNDLMENHRFTAGFQLPVNLSGSAYFLQYDNFTRRIDWGLMFLRTQDTYDYTVAYTDASNHVVLVENQPGKSITNMLQGNLTYPFDRIRSLRFHTALRLDQLNLKPVDPVSLFSDVPGANQYWSLSRVEYVFDNTITPALNIKTGFRYKFYGEYLYNLTMGQQYCYNLGVDFRYYHKLYKNFIWATRLAGAHSDGTAQVMYSLGGVDNWINPKSDNGSQPAGNNNYAFQTLATNLRGYEQNAFAGNSFAVLNTELRLPILTTFLRRPVQSAVLKNLQAVAFVDAGSGWVGILPDAANTAKQYNFSTVGNPNSTSVNPIYLQLTVPGSGGLGVGYGGGLRTSLLGYFLRLDAAWNISGSPKPIWYFSLGTDF